MEDKFLKEEVLAFIAILSVLFLFYLYYYTTKRKVFLNLIIRFINPSISGESLEFVSDKLAGILFTGISPFVIFVLIINILPLKIGFTVGRTIQLWYLLIPLTAITALISFFSSKSQKIQGISPELRIKNWYPCHLFLSVLGWLFYILGYEFFFRGILWFLCYGAFGFWPALVINILLYSLVHLPKGKLVTIGAIPVGVIFCLLSHFTGSFYPAFLIHACMAILTEISSVFHNPELHFRLSKSK